MMADLIFLPPAAKYLKKLKDKRLKTLYDEAISEICKDPAQHAQGRGGLPPFSLYGRTVPPGIRRPAALPPGPQGQTAPNGFRRSYA